MAMDISWQMDKALAARLYERDQGAFRLIVDRHYAATLRVAGRILGDQGEAEDAVQEAFLKCWRLAERYNPDRGSFRAWLMRVVVNQCLDRKRSLRSVESLEIAQTVATSAPSPEEQAGLARRSNRITAALSLLPVRQRAAIALFYGEGLRMSEVADLMETNVKAVESLLSRGRASLKEHLAMEVTEL